MWILKPNTITLLFGYNIPLIKDFQAVLDWRLPAGVTRSDSLFDAEKDLINVKRKFKESPAYIEVRLKLRIIFVAFKIIL